MFRLARVQVDHEFSDEEFSIESSVGMKTLGTAVVQTVATKRRASVASVASAGAQRALPATADAEGERGHGGVGEGGRSNGAGKVGEQHGRQQGKRASLDYADVHDRIEHHQHLDARAVHELVQDVR